MSRVGATLYASGNGTSNTTALLWPSGVAAGDVALVFALYKGDTITPNTPAGFATFGTPHQATSSMFIQAYRKVCTGAETGALAISWSGTSRSFWGLSVRRGEDIDVIGWTDGTTDAATSPAVADTNPARPECWWFERSSSPSTGITLSGAGTLFDSKFGTSTGACSGAMAYNDTLDSDGTIDGGMVFTRTPSSTNQYAVATVAWKSTVVTNTRVQKTGTPVTWNQRARLQRGGTPVTWNVVATIPTTRVQKTGTPVRFNVSSVIAEAVFPAYIAHRGGDPGPEETLPAYAATWTKNPAFWHEGDTQVLADGATMVASHDDTIDRMYASGPVATGNIISMTAAQWDATQLHINTGYTGSSAQAMRISAWTSAYGPSSGKPALGIWENKVGTPIAQTLAAFAGFKGQVIINGNTLSDIQAAVAAGFTGCHQTDTPDFPTLVSSGIKFISISMAAMTSAIGTTAHANGIKVLVYTVNSTTNRDTYAAMGADGFITNKPQTVYGMTRVQKTGTAVTWNQRARVQKTGTAVAWNDRQRLVKTGSSVSWTDLQRLSKTGTAVIWNDRVRVIKTGAAVIFDVAANIVTTRLQKTGTAVTWNDRQRLVKTGSSVSWNDRQRLTKTGTAATFNVRKRIVKTGTPVSFLSLVRASKTGTAVTWGVRTRSSKTGTAVTWAARGRLAKTGTPVLWKVTGPPGALAFTVWDGKVEKAATLTVWNGGSEIAVTYKQLLEL